jgi:hypothetical protein
MEKQALTQVQWLFDHGEVEDTSSLLKLTLAMSD